MVCSAGIMLLLGVIHLAYTFTGTHLLPDNAALQNAMRQGHLSITRETTVERAWMGFNASHGIALLLFGCVFGYLAIAHSKLLFESLFLLGLGFVVLVSFLALAKLYWFSVPFLALGIAMLLFVGSVIMGRAQL